MPEMWGIWDDLGLGYTDAARKELSQDKYKGYNPSTGTVNRGLMESLTDLLTGKDASKIQERTQELHVDSLKNDLGKKVGRINAGLQEIGAKDRQIEINKNSTRAGLTDEIETLGAKIPKVAEAQDLNPEGNYTIDSSIPSLSRGTRAGVRTESNTAYYDSPQYKQYLDQLKESDKRFNATQQLAISQLALGQQNSANQMQIAQMNNQLQMRREDAREARGERKDRQMMIMQMMKGLSQMGASIAI